MNYMFDYTPCLGTEFQFTDISNSSNTYMYVPNVDGMEEIICITTSGDILYIPKHEASTYKLRSRLDVVIYSRYIRNQRVHVMYDLIMYKGKYQVYDNGMEYLKRIQMLHTIYEYIKGKSGEQFILFPGIPAPDIRKNENMYMNYNNQLGINKELEEYYNGVVYIHSGFKYEYKSKYHYGYYVYPSRYNIYITLDSKGKLRTKEGKEFHEELNAECIYEYISRTKYNNEPEQSFELSYYATMYTNIPVEFYGVVYSNIVDLVESVNGIVNKKLCFIPNMSRYEYTIKYANEYDELDTHNEALHKYNQFSLGVYELVQYLPKNTDTIESRIELLNIPSEFLDECAYKFYNSIQQLPKEKTYDTIESCIENMPITPNPSGININRVILFNYNHMVYSDDLDQSRRSLYNRLLKRINSFEYMYYVKSINNILTRRKIKQKLGKNVIDIPFNVLKNKKYKRDFSLLNREYKTDGLLIPVRNKEVIERCNNMDGDKSNDEIFPYSRWKRCKPTFLEKLLDYEMNVYTHDFKTSKSFICSYRDCIGIYIKNDSEYNKLVRYILKEIYL